MTRISRTCTAFLACLMVFLCLPDREAAADIPPAVVIDLSVLEPAAGGALPLADDGPELRFSRGTLEMDVEEDVFFTLGLQPEDESATDTHRLITDPQNMETREWRLGLGAGFRF